MEPEVEPVAAGGPDTADVFASGRRSRWPRVHWGSVAVVAVGGFVGGIVRYAVGQAWPTAAFGFPWPTFIVNTAGALILGLLLALVLELLTPTPYLRPLVGTGFCGALTTFSSVVTQVDRLAGHGHAGLAAGYLAASVVAGLAAVWVGIVLGRSAAVARQKGRG